jgi:hypothetical protein
MFSMWSTSNQSWCPGTIAPTEEEARRQLSFQNGWAAYGWDFQARQR